MKRELLKLASGNEELAVIEEDAVKLENYHNEEELSSSQLKRLDARG